jgi:hypothetical protein
VAAPAAAGGDVRVSVVDCAADGEAEEEEEEGEGVGAGRGAGGSTASDASARAAELGQLLPSPTAAGRQSPGAGTAAARLPSPLSSGASSSGGRRASRTGGFALASLPSLLLAAVPGGAGGALAGASGGAAADSTDAGAGAGAGAGADASADAGTGLVVCDLSGRSAAAVSAQLRSVAVETASLLLVALFVNCSILITSAAAFHSRGLNDVATLEEAHEELAKKLAISLKQGRPLILLCSNSAPPFTSKYATNPARFPAALLDASKTKAILADNEADLTGSYLGPFLSYAQSEYKGNPSMEVYVPHKDFHVVVCTKFSPEDYKDFMGVEWPRELLQPIKVWKES